MVYHCNGDYYSEDGYTPTETALQAGGELRFAPNGGRPCDGAFPYYRLTFADGGHSIAVGWPAQWTIRFQGNAESVQVQSGQEKTHLRLLPGESIRTPRMTVLTWAGDSARAINLWRRWYLAHILPRPDGRPLRPLLACAATDEGEEFTAATEENQIRFMDTFKAARLQLRRLVDRCRVVSLLQRGAPAPLVAHRLMDSGPRALPARPAADLRPCGGAWGRPAGVV